MASGNQWVTQTNYFPLELSKMLLRKTNMNQVSWPKNYVVKQYQIFAMVLYWGHFISKQHKIIQQEEQY